MYTIAFDDSIFRLWLLLGIAIGALVGAAIGQAKGRVGAGLFFGLLLGPIGWLIIAVGPSNKRKCPDCLGTVPDAATKCMHCGAALAREAPPKESTAPTATEAAANRRYQLCPSCKAMHPLDAVNCECGHEFSAA